jgi:hypothetical protein
MRFLEAFLDLAAQTVAEGQCVVVELLPPFTHFVFRHTTDKAFDFLPPWYHPHRAPGAAWDGSALATASTSAGTERRASAAEPTHTRDVRQTAAVAAAAAATAAAQPVHAADSSHSVAADTSILRFGPDCGGRSDNAKQSFEDDESWEEVTGTEHTSAMQTLLATKGQHGGSAQEESESKRLRRE